MEVDDDGDDSGVAERDDLAQSRVSAMSAPSVESECFCVCGQFGVCLRYTIVSHVFDVIPLFDSIPMMQRPVQHRRRQPRSVGGWCMKRVMKKARRRIWKRRCVVVCVSRDTNRCCITKENYLSYIDLIVCCADTA